MHMTREETTCLLSFLELIAPHYSSTMTQSEHPHCYVSSLVKGEIEFCPCIVLLLKSGK